MAITLIGNATANCACHLPHNYVSKTTSFIHTLTMASSSTGGGLDQPTTEDPPSLAQYVYVTSSTPLLPEEATSKYEDDDGVFTVS